MGWASSTPLKASSKKNGILKEGRNSASRLPMDWRLQHHLLPGCPACQPALQVWDFPAPTIAGVNSFLSLSFSPGSHCYSLGWLWTWIPSALVFQVLWLQACTQLITYLIADFHLFITEVFVIFGPFWLHFRISLLNIRKISSKILIGIERIYRPIWGNHNLYNI